MWKYVCEILFFERLIGNKNAIFIDKKKILGISKKKTIDSR